MLCECEHARRLRTDFHKARLHLYDVCFLELSPHVEDSSAV